MTYNEFNEVTQFYFQQINSSNYEFKLLSPVITSYPGKRDEVWGSDKNDAYNNNAFQPKKIALIEENEDYLATVEFVFAPEFTQNGLLSVNSIDHILATSSNYKDKLPFVYSVNMMSRGMMINVSCFKINQSKATDKEIIDYTSRLIESLQNIIDIQNQNN